MTASATARLNLPFLQAGQALKNITHNEALHRLDSGLYLSCSDMAANSLPIEPPEDLVLVISQTPETELSDYIGQIAVFVSGRWIWFTPKSGWTLWDENGETLRIYNGSLWVSSAAESLPDNLPLLGLNAGAKPSQRLTISSESSLFNHDGDSHRLTLNRANNSDTASLIFQTDFTGEAELGLTGSGGFSLKTSADGTNFDEKLTTPVNYNGIRSPAFGSNRIRIANNTAVFVPTPTSGGIVALTIVHALGFPSVRHSGIFAYDTGSSRELITLAATERVENHGALTLDGTRSVDTNIGISVSTGGLYLENRLPNLRDFSLTFLC